MIEIKHNAVKIRNQTSLNFEALPGLVLGLEAEDIVPTIEEIVEPVIQETTISAIAENSYVKDGDEIKQLIFEMTHPIGSIIYTSNSANPSTYLGGGTWTQIEGRFLLGASSSYAAGSTGGSATHTLTVNELPSHTHGLNYNNYKSLTSSTSEADTSLARPASYTYNFTDEVGTLSTGSGAAHNNMPPYKVVYIWERTA